MTPAMILAATLFAAPCDGDQCFAPRARAVLTVPAEVIVKLKEAKPIRTAAGNVLDRQPVRTFGKRLVQIRPVRGVRERVANRRQARATRRR
jgi:hypothetical protein